MKDIINSFKAHLYERTSSPLIGAFIFYWLIFNYKLLIIIFSDLKPIDKFNEIASSVYPTWIHHLGYGIILPATITLIYILYFPYISNNIHKKWIEHQNELKKISNGKVLTKKEFGELQRRFTELELSFDETFSKKDQELNKLKELLDNKEKTTTQMKNMHISEIDKLNKLIEERTQEIQTLNNTINKLRDTRYKNNISISIEQYKLLEYIGENPQNNTSSLINTFNQRRVEMDKNCDELLNIGFIMIDTNYNNGDRTFRITDDGREYLLNKSPF